MRYRLQLLLLLLLVLPLAGCFSEHSFPMRTDRLVRPTAAQVSAPTGERLATRDWAAVVHTLAAPRLPAAAREALVSTTLHDAQGNPVNVYRHFGLDESSLDSILGNLHGLEQTAQVTSPPPGATPAPMWKGFHEVAVPMPDGLELYARLGTPEPADEIPGSYVVITHGLFGSLAGVDMENHVQALRRAGHHVLAIELRGHGVTGQRHPDAPLTFGVRETADLLATARWLKTVQHAQRVGLVAFSLSGYESLLAAWVDAAPLGADASRPIMRFVLTPSTEPAFNGGMFIVSVPIGIRATTCEDQKRWNLFEAPCKATFQQHTVDRMQAFGEPPPRNLWGFIESEMRRDGWIKTYGSAESLRHDMEWYLDLHNNEWATGVRRMNAIRTPILVLSAANDPLGTAQDVTELFARVSNPNIGVIMLNGGGHMGFAALSADYYYSLMRAFFDPATAPRAATPSVLVKAAPTALP